MLPTASSGSGLVSQNSATIDEDGEVFLWNIQFKNASVVEQF